VVPLSPSEPRTSVQDSKGRFVVTIAAAVGGGVGAELARIIASQGGVVVLLDIQEGLAGQGAKEIRGLGGTASDVGVDVPKPDSVRAAAVAVLARPATAGSMCWQRAFVLDGSR
jgi:NAD(P)-dependent dehydrogenase (short-subunit alcohol dehydrogenase family)